ncbi:hypothetical protein DITRI_Ditri12bG0082000 [Diplodiscus trichospermus]
MSYSPQGSTSIDDYPQSGKPVDEDGREEDPPQKGKSSHQNGQQQASPVGVLPPGHHLPKNNNPDMQSSHRSSHHHHQQSTLLEIPSSQGYPQKDGYPDNQQTTYNSSKDYLVEAQRGQPDDPNLTISSFPAKDQQKLQPVPAGTNQKFDQQMNSHNLNELTNSYKQKPYSQPQLHGGAESSKNSLPVPEGYPPFRPPTSPSKLEPQPKKGLLEKICCCFF